MSMDTPVLIRKTTVATSCLLSCNLSPSERGSTLTGKNLLPQWASGRSGVGGGGGGGDDLH